MSESALTEGDDGCLGRTFGGQFVALELIGKGAMGAVYRARDVRSKRDVALKVLPANVAQSEDVRVRFEREARAMLALVSPHSVRTYGFGASEHGHWFLAMELLVGETLGARLRRFGALSPEEAVRFARDVLKSLAEAHQKGIVHRDLKPDNLFLVNGAPDGGQLCKVLDFGIAKVATESELDPLETHAGTVVGTPRYMSPEQARGLPLDGRSDLYSVGVILYQMLTGAVPFEDRGAVMVMAKHMRELPPSLTDRAPHLASAPELVSAVRVALSKSPEDRPQTAGEFLRRLEEAIQPGASCRPSVLSTTAAGAVGLTHRSTKRPTRPDTAWWSLAVAACGVSLGLGWAAQHEEWGGGASAGAESSGGPDVPPISPEFLPGAVVDAVDSGAPRQRPSTPEAFPAGTKQDASPSVAAESSATHDASLGGGRGSAVETSLPVDNGAAIEKKSERPTKPLTSRQVGGEGDGPLKRVAEPTDGPQERPSSVRASVSEMSERTTSSRAEPHTDSTEATSPSSARSGQAILSRP